MEITIDARQDACPLPVIKAKKALAEMTEGTLTVLAGNETAVQNLSRLAGSQGCGVETAPAAEGHFVVRIMKMAGAGGQAAGGAGESGAAGMGAAPACACGSASGEASPAVVALSSDCMGAGDDQLGRRLMKGFVFALTQLDRLPECILLYNGGAKLAVEGAETLEDLRALEKAGVEVLTCGTCLDHYGIKDKLAVGQVTNMYVIAEKEMAAGHILRP